MGLQHSDQVGGARPPPAVRFRPGGAASAPLRPRATTTTLGSRRSEPTLYCIIRELWSKRRLVTDFPDTSDRCLSRLLSAGPRPRASRAASGASSAEAGPRWGGKETEHTIHVQQPSGKSFLGDALAPCLALESSWKAQTRVFCQNRGVSPVLSRRHEPKTLTSTAPQMFWSVSSTPPSARPAVGRTGWPTGSRWWVFQQHSLETCHSALQVGL